MLIHPLTHSRSAKAAPAGLLAAALIVTLIGLVAAPAAQAQSRDVRDVFQWEVHDRDRPQPPKVDPGTGIPQQQPGRPPSDAIVLFDGDDLDQWQSTDGGPAEWTLHGDHMRINVGSGSIETKQGFGDVQLHIEWASPDPVTGQDQTRGNSGVFFMDGRYEVQVLNTYDSATYPDGQAAALYGQYPPLVNAARPAGEWQSYDIIFRRPRFDADQKLVRPAYVTVFHNGVLVQDHVELTGPTAHRARPPYEYHAPELPLQLQDHGDSEVRYRNIWVRPLE